MGTNLLSRSDYMSTVLVADSVESGRELLRVLLEHEGFKVVEASNHLEAIAVARAILPDLILLDVDLPAIGGYSAVHEMRLDARLKNRHIMAVFDSRFDTSRERLLEAGFSGYIAKPVVLRTLRQQLIGFAACRSHELREA